MKALNIKLTDYLPQDQLDSYLSYLRLEKSNGLSEGTVERYLLNLKHLCLESRKPPFEIKTYAEISPYIRSLRAKNLWSPSTTKNAADSFSVFYNWAARFNVIDHNDNPMRLGHEFKNKDRRQMDFFEWSEGDFRKLMYHPNNTVKESAILHTLRSSGLRSADVVNLTFKDVDMKSRWFFVKNGKGGKDRYAPFDEETFKWLSLYMDTIRLHSGEPWLFQTRDFKQYTTHALYMLILQKAAKIGIHGCPQKFRRSLGGEMIANGADLSDVQQVLGHESPQTTARHYIRHKKKRLKERYDKGIPRFSLVETA